MSRHTLRDGKVIPFTGARNTERFVNPLNPQVQRYELSLIREVTTRYPVDGVMLDWLRFDDYPMDLSAASRRAFKTQYGVDPILIDFSKESAARDNWTRFRTEAIARYVSRVRALVPRSMMLGAYILPPEFVEVAQDAAQFRSHTDVLAPMCYFSDCGFSVEWFWENCLASSLAKAGTTGVEPVLGIGYSDEEFSLMLSHIRQDAPGVATLESVRIELKHSRRGEGSLSIRLR